jgi:peptide-methionine (R)-S-oxide reductase
MKQFAILLLALVFINCQTSAQKKVKKETFKITKTEKEWQESLTPLQYHVLREAGTEPPFSSPLNKNYKKGTYVCAACGTPLFKSKHKFDSGTGWPSFDREIKGNVAFSTDNKLRYPRTEEHCAVCGGHLGHVFDDGPPNTTGKRHCINGAALKFIPEN